MSHAVSVPVRDSPPPAPSTVLPCELAATVSVSLASSVAPVSSPVTLEDAAQAIRATRSLAALRFIREWLTREDLGGDKVQQVADLHLIDDFVILLNDTNSEKQHETAWILTNIMSTTDPKHVTAVVNAGAVAILVDLLQHRSTTDEVREQSAWALSNIAGDTPDNRDHVLKSGALSGLLFLLDQNPALSLSRVATWALSNLCRGKPAPPFDLVQRALPTLSELLLSQDVEVLSDACWSVAYLSDGSNEKIQAVIDTANLVPRLLRLLGHRSYAVLKPALRSAGNIAIGSNAQTEVLIAEGAIPLLRALMQHPSKYIRKDTCWMLSNIAAGTRSQIQALIDADVITGLVSMMSNENDFPTRKEAAWAIKNMSHGSPAQIQCIAQHECLSALCGLLGVMDPLLSKIGEVVLDALGRIMRTGAHESRDEGASVNRMVALVQSIPDGVYRIKRLQQHDNTNLRAQAEKMVNRYGF